jgi:hypothetical protein
MLNREIALARTARSKACRTNLYPLPDQLKRFYTGFCGSGQTRRRNALLTTPGDGVLSADKFVNPLTFLSLLGKTE